MQVINHQTQQTIKHQAHKIGDKTKATFYSAHFQTTMPAKRDPSETNDSEGKNMTSMQTRKIAEIVV